MRVYVQCNKWEALVGCCSFVTFMAVLMWKKTKPTGTRLDK
jgi:hypothetical protein